MQPDQSTALIDAVPMPLLRVGGDGRILAANPPARTLFGGDIVTRPFFAVFRQPALLERLDAALIAGEGGVARVTLTFGGREAVFRVTTTPLAGSPLASSGRGGGAVLAFEDLSALEQAEAMRRDFLANVSHELRTPLTALVGFIETLKGAARDDPAARARFLEIMEREAERMTRLVDDLLQLSRVEAEERMRPDPRIDLGPVLQGATAALRPLAEAAGMDLTLTGVEAPILLRADADQITQVFLNLIENAIKYGQGGPEVTVEVTALAHDAALRGPAVRFCVIDRGEGIEQHHIARLTERFYRVDTHRSRQKGGTGLGLAIVKHIVNRHRGRMRIDSALGQGTTVSVFLPTD